MNKFSKALVSIAILAASTLPFSASAQITETKTASMQVTLTVIKSCTITANNMDFGKVLSGAGDQEQSSSANVVCTKDTPYNITASSTNGFKLKNTTTGSSVEIPYLIAASTSTNTTKQDLTNSWENIQGTGTGDTQTVTLYGNVSGSDLRQATEGSYSDTVTLSVNY